MALSNTEICKLTATITGGGFKRANSKEAAVSRFLKLAEAKMPAAQAAGIQQHDNFRKATEALDAALRPAKRGPIAEAIDAAIAQGMSPKEFVAAAEAVAKKIREPKQGKRAEIQNLAEAGILPDAPDFSAETHKRFRPKLAELVALVAAGDIAGLKAFAINPISSSPKALDKYRNLAVIALEAQRATTRPGDQAAIYAEEAGISYSAALVACNMD